MAREIFKLVGLIGTMGVEKSLDELKGIDKQARIVAKGFDHAGKAAMKMGKTLSAAVTAPLAAVGASMLFLAGKTGEYADKLLDLEQITGLSTDNLQGLEHVSRAAGVSFEGLTGTISKFQTRLPQIINETGTAYDSIRALGVSVFDSSGKVRDMNTLFPEMITKLQGIENVTERNALAQQIFGRSMQDLAPVLGLGAGALEKLMGEAGDLGLVMSKDALNAANDYRIGMENLKASFTAVWRNLATQFIPLLTDELLPAIRAHVIPALNRVGEVVGGVIGWFSGLSLGMKKTIVSFVAIAAAIGPVLIVTGKLIMFGKFLVPLFAQLVTGQLSLNAAMAANPIGFIITLIALLVAAGVALYNNWDYVVEKMTGAWDAIVYVTLQSVSSLKQMIGGFALKFIDSLDAIGKVIPGFAAKLEGARLAIEAMMITEKLASTERTIARIETKQQALANKELAETVEAAKIATDTYTASTVKLIDARKEDKAAIDEVAKAEEKLLLDRSAFEEQYTAKVREQILTRAQAIDFEEQEALIRAEELGAEKYDIEMYYWLERQKLREQEEEGKDEERLRDIEKEKARYAQTYSMAVGAVGQLFSLMSQSSTLEMQRIDSELAHEKAAIANSKMSKEQQDKAMQALDARAETRKKDLLRKQAAREKAAAIFGAIINTAQAISKALTLGFPLGIVAAVIMGALGVAQIALIAAQPMPQFAKGGMVKGGRGGVTAEVGEGLQDELVLPMKTGVDSFVDSMLSKLSSVTPQGGPQMALAGVGGGSSGGGLTLNIGTLIGDDRSIKELERRMSPIRTSEAQRMGK